VSHRIKVAGGKDTARFDPEALRLVHQFSEGIPRRVNAVSDMAMLSAYGRGQDRVDVQAVEAAVKELQEIGQ
jgi:general secretion pathway protein A